MLPEIKRARFPRKETTASSRCYWSLQTWSPNSFDGHQWRRKTTLMDVLSGRKTGGFIEGDIKVGDILKFKPHMPEYLATVSKSTYILHSLRLRNQWHTQLG